MCVTVRERHRSYATTPSSGDVYENSVCRRLGPVLVNLIDAFVTAESDRKKDLGDILFLDFQQNVDLSTRLWSFLVSKADAGEEQFQHSDATKTSQILA